MNIAEFLRNKNVPFELCRHRPTYDALHLAEAMHVTCKNVAKTVLLRVNGGFKYVLAILPATHVIDLPKLSKALGGTHIQLATEAEMAARCPDCELGVLPPFGTHYNLESVIDPTVPVNEQIVFESNTHDQGIRMRYRDFCDLEHPLVAEFAVPAGEASLS